jgi:hypothetical protein
MFACLGAVDPAARAERARRAAPPMPRARQRALLRHAHARQRGGGGGVPDGVCAVLAEPRAADARGV